MKHTKKRIITMLGIAGFGMAVLFSPAVSATVQAAPPSTADAEPCADVISYRYKEVNGKLYRRLYNHTTGAWIGEWQYVGDL